MDLLRKAVSVTQASFNYCLSCATTPCRRSRSLARIAGSARTLLDPFPGSRCLFDDLLCRLLLKVLREGPNAAWDSSYLVLQAQALTCGDILQLSDVHMILDLLRGETWGDEGNALRVCIMHALFSSLLTVL